MMNHFKPWLFFALFLSVLPAYANFTRPPILIEHLDAQYQDKKGSIAVSRATYQVHHFSFLHQNFSAKIGMQGTGFTIDDGSTQFSIDEILNFLSRFQTIQAKDLNFNFQDSHFIGTIQQSTLGVSEKRFLMSMIQTKCGLPQEDVLIEDDTLQLMLEICLIEGNWSISELTFPKGHSLLKDGLEGALASLNSSEALGLSRIENLQLHFDHHSFDLTAQLKVGLNWNFHATGQIQFESNAGRYRIEVKDAKIGVLGVRKWIFLALKKLADPSILVEEPFIYLDYQPSSKSGV